MAGKGPSPLLGYNTNVRRKGVLCHVQTEDSGIAHPHVITHVFTAGTIIGTRKLTYQEHLGEDNLETTVRKLMQGQHKAMCIALRDGEFDANLPTRDTVKVPAFREEADQVDPAEAEAAEGGDAIAAPPIETAEDPLSAAEKMPTLELDPAPRRPGALHITRPVSDGVDGLALSLP